MYSMKRKEVKRAAIKQVVDRSEGNPFINSVEDNWRALGEAFHGVQATGAPTSIAELTDVDLRPRAPTATLGSAPAGSSPLPASAGPNSGLGFGFGYSAPPSDTPNPIENCDGRKDKTPQRGRKRPGEAGSGVAADGGPRKPKGRPRRDLAEEMRKIVLGFTDCKESDSTFWAGNFKTRERNARRLLADVDERVKADECPADEAQELTKGRKRVACILQICKYVSSHSFSSDGFSKVFF